MSSALDVNFWPPLIWAAIYTIAAALTLSPLGETTYVPAALAAPADTSGDKFVRGVGSLALPPGGSPAALSSFLTAAVANPKDVGPASRSRRV